MKSALPDGSAMTRRAHLYSRLTTAIAVLALALAGYALWRLDATRDRLDQVNDFARTLDAQRNALQTELRTLAEREQRNAREVAEQLETLNTMSRELRDLSTSVEDLHARTQGPQRAWSRAEALFLVEIAQRSLLLDRNVATAIAALESADTRLASVRDPSLTAVRQQLASDLQALRAAHVPDRTGLAARLAAAEASVAQLPVRGLNTVAGTVPPTETLPQGFFARVRARVLNALAGLIRIRPVDESGGTVVTDNEALVRRQHLQLLLFSARTALARYDESAYRDALATARQWLGASFDMKHPGVLALLREVQSLEAVVIDPRLPDISKSADSLQRMTLRNGAEVER